MRPGAETYRTVLGEAWGRDIQVSVLGEAWGRDIQVSVLGEAWGRDIGWYLERPGAET